MEDDERDDDLRSLPDSTLQLYLGGIVAWGFVLVLLYLFERTAAAIPLTYAVFVWQALLTGWWGSGVMRAYDSGELSSGEARAGVQSVARIVTASALLPAVAFLIEDPLAASSWTAAAGTVAVAAVMWLLIATVGRIQHRVALVLLLALANLALPINATGAVSVGIASGFFDRLLL
ncbi:MAG: hypothetical protein H6736_21815 [Alphaproteobacteria bacterium]|nr:hypothetical protein [Alphaproteobacteria bacterium]MCB9694455.1 hypothetical protein [Alphaproteobacteria bacterium]